MYQFEMEKATYTGFIGMSRNSNMPSSVYASSSETTNTNRTSRVLLGPCTDQLRDVLRHHIPPGNLPNVINQRSASLPRLTQPQRDLILPRSSHYSGNYNDMDISLLYLLLRNICGIQPHGNGWGNTPDVTDNSLSANIERIRETRNNVVHNARSSMPQTEFNDRWFTIKEAVKSLDTFLNNGKKFEKEVEFLRRETMDPEQEVRFTEQLRRQVEEDKQIRDMLTETQRSVETLANNSKDQNEKLKGLGSDIKELLQRTDSTTVKPDEEHGVTRLKQKLIQINDLKAPLAPLQEGGHTLPIEQLFASVVIEKASKETMMGKMPIDDGNQQLSKEVKSPMYMFEEQVRRIYMIGDAGHGKTTYCMWLLKKWCNAHLPGMSGRPLNEWENALSQFDFVFYIHLHHVDPSRANVTDMICQDIFESDSHLQRAVNHVLDSYQYRCLIMLDGLDEWKPNQFVIDQWKYRGMPYIENMSNCIIFTTMRPWMFATVAGSVCDLDRVVEIKGLDDKGIGNVIEKVLVHFYKKEEGDDEYEQSYKEIISKLEDHTLKSFIQIPLLAVVCVQIWYKREPVGESMTSFYSAMINMLMERAYMKHQIQNQSTQATSLALPKILSSMKNINKHINVLLKLGKIALMGLLSKRMEIEDQKEHLETEIDEKELQIALHIGLISQKETECLYSKNVRIHFFHTSIQEFLAVIFIVSQEGELDSFCNHLPNVDAIMELSYAIRFICGMIPSFASILSEHIVTVTDKDAGIIQYRDSPSQGLNPIAEELYKLQVTWYRELQHGLTNNESQVPFHIADVYLNYHYIDLETVRLTTELLLDDHVDIRSLFLWEVPIDGDLGIDNKLLNEALSKTKKIKSLVKLYINGDNTLRYINPICGPKLKVLVLKNITVRDTGPVQTLRHPLLSSTPMLHKLELWSMNLRDGGLGLTQEMVHIEDIVLQKVNMPTSEWQVLLRSLMNMKHTVYILLYDTNIDLDSFEIILNSDHFRITRCGCDQYRKYRLNITKVWPL